MLLLQLFSLLLFWNRFKNGQNRNLVKNSNWKMHETPGKMHMYDMVKIDKIVFEIVDRFNSPPPPRIVSCLK